MTRPVPVGLIFGRAKYPSRSEPSGRVNGIIAIGSLRLSKSRQAEPRRADANRQDARVWHTGLRAARATDRKVRDEQRVMVTRRDAKREARGSVEQPAVCYDTHATSLVDCRELV